MKRRLFIIALVLSILLAVALGASACSRATTVSAAPTGSVSVVESSSTAASTAATSGGTGATAATTAGSETAAGATSATSSGAAASDTSYTDSTKSVTISKVTAGSGDDTVTYYVADITLSAGAGLQSAFSNGSYGGKTQDTSTMAQANDAVVAINGDYYSARDDGIVIRNGVIYRDVPARTGLVIYKDGTMKVYDETSTTAEQLLADGAWNTYSFGPGLLEDGSVVSGIDDYEADPTTRHTITGAQPRTGIGMIAANHFVFVVVDGRSPGYSRGVTPTEFAQIFQSLGCTTAYNLDGGGSSTLYFMGTVVNDPSQRNGERAVSDILFVG